MKEDTKRIKVHSVQVYGHHYSARSRKSLAILDDLVSVHLQRERGKRVCVCGEGPCHNLSHIFQESLVFFHEDGVEEVEGTVLLLRIMYIVVALLQDLSSMQTKLKLAYLDPAMLTVL